MSIATQNAEIQGKRLDEWLILSETLPSGLKRTTLSVPDLRCGACVAKIERALESTDAVASARANLTLKTVLVDWHPHEGLQAVLDAMKSVGFAASIVCETSTDSEAMAKRYLRATAVAGFAAGNIMMLSVAVWAGADEATRYVFHVLSAVLAVAAVAYSGSLFFESAWTALRHRTTNMDVPISVGIVLTLLMGLHDTWRGGADVYFEATTMLIFFLLIGRTLDHSMRRKAESSLNTLAQIMPRTAMKLEIAVNGEFSKPHPVPCQTIEEGEFLLVSAHTRLALDAVIVRGESEFDTSIVDGESQPKDHKVGDELSAGVMNLGEPVIVSVIRCQQNSFLNRTQRLVETATAQKGRYESLSEQVARWYAPVVHLAALMAGLSWYAAGADAHTSISIAIAVLIITCPCALGLAVPMVHVLAGGILFRQGVVMKNGAALERLATIDTVVLDKTGTLTEKSAKLASEYQLSDKHALILCELSKSSSHPFARAIAATCLVDDIKSGMKDCKEIAGKGIQAVHEGVLYRLGKPSWAIEKLSDSTGIDTPQSRSFFSANGRLLTQFDFNECLRSDALSTIQKFADAQVRLCVASGDQHASVANIADLLSIGEIVSHASPSDKSNYVEHLKQSGRSVLMVGDGINDTVALTAANVSFAMGDAGDIGASSSDFVLLHSKLGGIYTTWRLAAQAKRIVTQNIAIAVVYNLVAMPLAFAGWVSPLIAAIAMSLSSILVVGNSLRLSLFDNSSKPTSKKQISQFTTVANLHGAK